MNPKTFNDGFAPSVGAIFKKNIFEGSPILLWDIFDREPTQEKVHLFTPEEAGFVCTSSGLLLPFPKFRVFVKMWGQTFKFCIANSGSKEGTFYCFARRLSEIGWTPVITTKFYLDESIKDFLITTRIFDQKQNIFVELPNPKDHTDIAEKAFLRIIIKVCIDFQNPHFHLCKKCPPLPQGKSIIWQEQRTHYVLLHKSHPANSKTAGKVVVGEPQILRMAHSRRAHFRLLTSPKFKNKHGQRVWVKSSWVGPKEWQDQGGQIYRIVERNQKQNEQPSN